MRRSARLGYQPLMSIILRTSSRKSGMGIRNFGSILPVVLVSFWPRT